MNMEIAARRPYQMVARAQSAAATRERILDVAVEAFWEQPDEQVSLDQVARRAQVSVQTVIRRFGGRDGLFAAAVERETERTRAERDRAPVGDPQAAVSILLDHYEALGDRVLALLGEEQRLPRLGEVADAGRKLHREWCQRVFAAA